jgi:hypothetical protein
MTRTPARPSLRCPIPAREFAELRAELDELAVPVEIDDSWADCPPLFSTPSLEGVDGLTFNVDARRGGSAGDDGAAAHSGPVGGLTVRS